MVSNDSKEAKVCVLIQQLYEARKWTPSNLLLLLKNNSSSKRRKIRGHGLNMLHFSIITADWILVFRLRFTLLASLHGATGLPLRMMALDRIRHIAPPPLLVPEEL